jgi:hypothetical protein
MENYKEADGGLNDIFTGLRKMFVSCLFQLSLCSKYTFSCLSGKQPSRTGSSHYSGGYSPRDSRESRLLPYEGPFLRQGCIFFTINLVSVYHYLDNKHTYTVYTVINRAERKRE